MTRRGGSGEGEQWQGTGTTGPSDGLPLVVVFGQQKVAPSGVIGHGNQCHPEIPVILSGEVSGTKDQAQRTQERPMPGNRSTMIEGDGGRFSGLG